MTSRLFESGMLCMLSTLDAIVLWGSAGRRLRVSLKTVQRLWQALPHALFLEVCFTRYIRGEFDLDLASCLMLGEQLVRCRGWLSVAVETRILLDLSHIEGYANHGDLSISSSFRNIGRYFLSFAPLRTVHHDTYFEMHGECSFG